MSNKATDWVWDHIEPVDNRIEKVQRKVSSQTHRPFAFARKYWRRPFNWTDDKIGSGFDKGGDVLEKAHDKLPHPRQHWRKVRDNPTFGTRLRGGSGVLVRAGIRLAGNTLCLATLIVGGGTRFGTWLAVRVPQAAGWRGSWAVEGAFVLVPWFAFVAARLTVYGAGGAAHAVLVAPQTVRYLAGLPARWTRGITHWLVHGRQSATAPAPTLTAPAAPEKAEVATASLAPEEPATKRSLRGFARSLKAPSKVPTIAAPAEKSAPKAPDKGRDLDL